jgi:N-acetylglucosamine-6-phosphate deacetylase
MPPLILRAGRLLTPDADIRDAAILIEEGKISSVGRMVELTAPANAEIFDASALTAVPGFVDVHIHGAGGHDVMEGTAEALDAVCATAARFGTTSLLATTASAAIEDTCRSVEQIARYIRSGENTAQRSSKARIVGIHLEGPFISRKRRGVHPQQWIAEPSLPVLRRILEAADGCARILTLAPEVPGALELVAEARKAGLIVALGHTDATYEEAQAVIAAGARHAVHVFNAMRPFSHRDTGVLGAVLTSPEVTAEIIADGVHVDDPAIRLLLAAKGTARVILVSDATSATAMPDGRYRLGTFEVTVSGGVCRSAEGHLAGSTLTLDRAVCNIAALGVPLGEAVRMATQNPAQLLSLEKQKGVLTAGADADIVLLDEAFRVQRVIIAGVWAR